MFFAKSMLLIHMVHGLSMEAQQEAGGEEARTDWNQVKTECKVPIAETTDVASLYLGRLPDGVYWVTNTKRFLAAYPYGVCLAFNVEHTYETNHFLTPHDRLLVACIVMLSLFQQRAEHPSKFRYEPVLQHIFSVRSENSHFFVNLFSDFRCNDYHVVLGITFRAFVKMIFRGLLSKHIFKHLQMIEMTSKSFFSNFPEELRHLIQLSTIPAHERYMVTFFHRVFKTLEETDANCRGIFDKIALENNFNFCIALTKLLNQQP